jgi:hypothetical protein
MNSFDIFATRVEAQGADELHHIRILARDEVLTRLVRNGGSEEDEALRAPATPLAFWLVDNWWRVLFEPVPIGGPDPSWRLAHELSSIGGYLWPRLALWGEGERVGITVHQEPLPAHIQFLARGIQYVVASDVEAGVDRFIRQILAEPIGDRAALRSEYRALAAERADQDVRTWRIVEAMLGFDVDEAPPRLVEELGGLMEQHGESGVEEAIHAMPGVDAATALKAGVEAASKSPVRARLPVPVKNIVFDRDPAKAPWELGEEAAKSLRGALSLTGPIRNPLLGEIFGVLPRTLDRSQTVGRRSASKLPYGLRLREDDADENRIVLQRYYPQARRFELCRNVGDILWSSNDALGPVTDAASGRQKFQRAFAQSFLCPYSELLEYCEQSFGPDDVAAAAGRFHVSERTVETILVNKGHRDRNAFMERVQTS